MIPPKVRKAVIARAREHCERCGIWLDIQAGAYSLHHRRLRSQGGKDEATTLTLLCGHGTALCHLEVHSKRLLIGEPEGYIVPSHTDPATIPILHWELGPVLLTESYTYEELEAA